MPSAAAVARGGGGRGRRRNPCRAAAGRDEKATDGDEEAAGGDGDKAAVPSERAPYQLGAGAAWVDALDSEVEEKEKKKNSQIE